MRRPLTFGAAFGWMLAATAAGAQVPATCTEGLDPGSGAAWVVCDADATTAWVSSTDGGGGYHPQLICEELGYDTVNQFGGTLGSTCGRSTAATSCLLTGPRIFDGDGDCGTDTLGRVLCFLVQWECTRTGQIAPTAPAPVVGIGGLGALALFLGLFGYARATAAGRKRGLQRVQ